MAQDQERTVGVYADEASARAAAADARARGADVRIGDDDDMRSALRGEMRQETDDLIVGPGMPGFTKEMTRNIVPWSIIGSLLGALVLLPFAFMRWGDTSLVQRMVWMVVSGVFFGGTIGFMLAGILGSRSQNKAPAAQRGVTVSAAGGTPGTEIDLTAHDPIRVERVAADGFPIETLATEDDLQDGLLAERNGRALRGTDAEDEVLRPQ